MADTKLTSQAATYLIARVSNFSWFSTITSLFLQTCQVQEKFFAGNNSVQSLREGPLWLAQRGKFLKFKPPDPRKMAFQHFRSWSQTHPNIKNFSHKHTKQSLLKVPFLTIFQPSTSFPRSFLIQLYNTSAKIPFARVWNGFHIRKRQTGTILSILQNVRSSCFFFPQQGQ